MEATWKIRVIGELQERREMVSVDIQSGGEVAGCGAVVLSGASWQVGETGRCNGIQQ